MTDAVRLPSNLRPATAEDIKVGALIWYDASDSLDSTSEPYYCMVVEEVLRPNDPWKAYSAEDGCRYGLDGAMVEIKPEAGTPKATVEDLIKARSEMENKIKTAVQCIVADFEADTGLTPSSIFIGIREIQEFGARRNRYIITDVETSVTI